MRSLNKPLALLGFFVVFLSTIFCPFLKVPLQSNWNLYQVDSALFIITIGLLGLCVLLFFMRRLPALRIASWTLVGWIVLSFILVFFQINNFLGFKLLDGLLSKTLNLKWGWGVLMLGALLIVFSIGKLKSKALE